MMNELVLLRPWWLLSLLPLALLWWQLRKRRAQASDWENEVDAQLMPYVLERGDDGHNRMPLLLLAFAWIAVVLVLSGPSWEQKEMPVYQGQTGTVIVLDLSRSMDVEDLTPSRLARAKFKLTDILDALKGVQTGLVVFSEVPYIVSPLTDDMDTLKAFLPALETTVVPVQGSRLVTAIELAGDLLQRSSVEAGSMLIITDGVADASALEAAQSIRSDGFTLSVMGVGTSQGSPIKQPDGNFIADANGNIVLARLEPASLQQLARNGGGVYTPLQADNRDVAMLAASLMAATSNAVIGEARAQSSHYIEHAPFLLFPVLLLMLYVFRRGVL